MATGTVSLSSDAGAVGEAESAPSAPAWRGRVVEFLLVGGATLFLFPVAWLLRRALGLESSELAVGFTAFYAAYVINDPHFAVTYLLFYKDARRRALGPDLPLAQRVRWVVAGVVVPVALVTWAILALVFHSAQTLGWMIQLMFLLVGWHYVKQGFGVLTVLSARRGVRVTARERSAVLFHCFAGWAFAWANPATPAGEFEEKGVVYGALAHPRWLELITGGAFALSAVVLVGVLVASRRSEGRMLPIAPLSGLLVTIWAWTVYSSIDPLIRYVIPALHSIQYLYFVWLMKRNEARASEGPPTFGRPVAVRLAFLAISSVALAWLLFRGAPAYLDGIFVPPTARGAVPDALGETPFFAAIFVIVNLHHYFMDHVIWRRENPDTRYLRA
ncbi:MAG: hypothetical protein JWO86_3076 [Myxococcaceae bacterium]|nr:hypothetical protein [Myxococcaceae bacterium]